MRFAFEVLLASVALLLGVLLLAELGRRLGQRHAVGAGPVLQGVGAAEAAVFALLGLLLAFTFSGAAQRFEARRDLITREANALGTAWLRLDLLPDTTQAAMRTLLRDYLDARLASFDHARDEATRQSALTHASALQRRLWQQAVAEARMPGALPAVGTLLLPALNEVFDLSTTRAAATHNHPPLVVYLLLAVSGLVAALLFGYAASANPRRPWAHQLSFALILALTAYVILDLEFPRLGLIRVDDADQVLSGLRASWVD